jgi:transcriptional regulator with XRE-family HTH domain
MKYPIRPTAAQIRAARALLNWHQPDLAKACGVSRESIAQIESGKSQGTQSNIEKIMGYRADSTKNTRCFAI